MGSEMCIRDSRFTDCVSRTRPISTNPGSMESGDCGRTRGTHFVARCGELVVVAELMWVSWCVFGGEGFVRVFVSIIFVFERTRPAASMRPPCLIHLSTSITFLVPGSWRFESWPIFYIYIYSHVSPSALP